MCSIAGVIGTGETMAARAAVAAMNRVQRHRGPDGEGLAVCGCAVLGHRRLAIIDPAGGAQPMTDESGRITIVCNGEIYNHETLREELAARGHHFQSRCDAEVLPHLYEEYGDGFVERLEGMFAFALFDANSGHLLLARDRAGQKPLHYFVSGGTLVFASELAALKCHPDFPAELDPRAISEYLSLLFVPAPRTVYRHVRQVPPAHTLTFDPVSGAVAEKRYWRPDWSRRTRLSFSEAAEQLREETRHAVRARLMADVPLSVFLSGGVDSAVIAAFAAAERAPEPTNAFTIGFDERAYDERDAAKRSAAFIRSQTGGALVQHVRAVDPGNFDTLVELAGHFGQPYADASMLPTALLSRFAREESALALSGDAADELFAGYERYLACRLAARFDRLPAALRRGLFRTLAHTLPERGERTLPGRLRRLLLLPAESPERRYFAILDRCGRTLKNQLAGERLREAAARDAAEAFDFELTAETLLGRLQETDFYGYLPSDILPKVDIASMAAGLEVRSPFLDHRIIEFAASLPDDWKLRGRERKYIFRRAYAGLVPEELWDAPKKGFGVPVAQWLRKRWQEPVRARLFGGALDGWVREPAVRTLWREHQSGRDRSYPLFALLMLAIFLESETARQR